MIHTLIATQFQYYLIDFGILILIFWHDAFNVSISIIKIWLMDNATGYNSDENARYFSP